jgi:Dolichyl-phosphate-mannose-protein mannosyltransferase
VKEPSAHTTLLAIVVILGAGLRLWGIGFGLPHPMTRPDEEFIVSKALGFFGGDYNPHFFEWPSFYFYVVHAVFTVVYLVGHVTGAYADVDVFTRATAADPAWAHLALRLMSVAWGTATLLVAYSLAKSLFDRSTALVSAALLAVSYLHVRDSHFGVLDVALTLAIVASVRFLVKAAMVDRPAVAFAIAGALAGLATSIKYNAAALLAAGLAAGLVRFLRAPSGERVTVSAGLGGFLIMFVGCFVAASPYVILDADAFRAGMTAQVARLTEGHGIAIERVWLRHLTFSLWFGVGAPVLMASGAGFVLLGLRDWRTALLLGAFPIAYFLVIGNGHTAFIRYTTPMVPFLCVLAGVAIRQIAGASARFPSARRGYLVLAALTAALALPSIVTIVRFDRLLTERDTRLIAADWLSAHVSGGASVFESGASYARPLFAWGARAALVSRPEFDPVRSAFVTERGAETTPDWIVIAESPLRLYTPVSPELRGVVSAGYELAHTVEPARDPEPEIAFDRQDAFFLPYADFSARERPGPKLSIYRRR